jgi:hypothetical protein
VIRLKLEEVDVLREKTLTIASHYKTFKSFRCAHPELYDALLRRPVDLKELHEMFEDGRIQAYEPVTPRKKDGTFWYKDGRTKESLPTIRREQVRKFAKYYRTHQNFRGKAGKYADAAKRLGMCEELEAFFSHRLTVPEIRAEAATFPDWESFAIDRPKYAHDAEKHGIVDAITYLMEQNKGESK